MSLFYVFCSFIFQIWADSVMLLPEPKLLLSSNRFKTAVKKSKLCYSYLQKTFREYKIQISLFAMSMNQSATSIHAKVSLLHAKVSHLHAKVSYPHTKVSHPHTKVSHPHAKVSHPHAKVSHLTGIVSNFIKLSTAKITSLIIKRT